MHLKERLKTMADSPTYERIYRYAECFFLIMLFVYVAELAFQTTMFSTYFLMGLNQITVKMITLAVIFKVAFSLKNWKSYLYAFVFYVAVLLIGKVGSFGLMTLAAIVFIGTIGIDYRKLLRGQIITVGSILLLAVTGCFCGTVRNLIYVHGGSLRDSFGIIYPTDFASYLFYLLVFFWIAWGELSHWFTLALCILMVFIARVYAISDTCTICGLAFAVILAGFLMYGQFVKRFPVLLKLKKPMDLLLTFAFPLCAVLIFILIFLYGMETGVGETLNTWLSNRLRLAWDSLQENGITLFGTPITQVGNGGSTFPKAGYNFVDSTYPLLLIRYGWLCFGIVCTFWVWMTWRAVKCHDYRLAFGMALICLHSISEHHFPEINYNLLMFLPFALLPKRETVEAPMGAESRGRVEKAGTLVHRQIPGVFLVLALAALTAPLWLTWMRTICGWRRMVGAEDEVLCLLLLFFAFAGVIVSGACVAACLFKQDNNTGRGKGMYAKFAVFLVLFAIAATGVFWGVRKAKEETQHIVQADAAAMELILQNHQGKIYVNDLPSVYQSRFGQIAHPVFYGEDLARYRGSSILAARDEELILLFRSGFCYVPISEYTAVYTGDEKVQQALKVAGYPVLGFFDGKVETPLPVWSTGPVDLYSGKYTVDFYFRVKDIQDPADFVANMSIYGNHGIDFLMQRRVSASYADEEGNIHFSVPLTLVRDTPGVKFYLIGDNGYEPDVKEISYRRTPVYDTHYQYDEDRRLIQETYFSMDGVPLELHDGIHTLKYTYDEDGNRTAVQYYDREGLPVNVHGLYAQILSSYDEKGHLIRQEYRDDQGRLVNTEPGYAVLEILYDAAGEQDRQRLYDAEEKLLYERFPTVY